MSSQPIALLATPPIPPVPLQAYGMIPMPNFVQPPSAAAGGASHRMHYSRPPSSAQHQTQRNFNQNSNTGGLKQQYSCDACERDFRNQRQYETHLAKHEKVTRQREREKREYSLFFEFFFLFSVFSRRMYFCCDSQTAQIS
jgi:hypothetical protein